MDTPDYLKDFGQVQDRVLSPLEVYGEINKEARRVITKLKSQQPKG